jgi:hypothetical protein
MSEWTRSPCAAASTAVLQGPNPGSVPNGMPAEQFMKLHGAGSVGRRCRTVASPPVPLTYDESGGNRVGHSGGCSSTFETAVSNGTGPH